VNEDLKRVTGDYKKLQEAYNSMKKQLSSPAPPSVVSHMMHLYLTELVLSGYTLHY